eukprot:6738429-Alexandrium_andersonii.AAC.1
MVNARAHAQNVSRTSLMLEPCKASRAKPNPDGVAVSTLTFSDAGCFCSQVYHRTARAHCRGQFRRSAALPPNFLARAPAVS